MNRAADLREPVVRAREKLDRRQLEASVTEHADFMARTLRNLGVDDAHVDLALEKAFLLTLRQEPTSEAIADRAALFRAAAKVAAQARKRWPRRTPSSDAARAELDSLLDCLPEEEREVFVLCEIEELDEAWAATALGHQRSWARTRLRRAHRVVCSKLGVPVPPSSSHPRLRLAVSGDARRALEAGQRVSASARARARTLRAVDAVSSVSFLGRMTLLLSRLSLAVLLALVVALAAAAYFVFHSL